MRKLGLIIAVLLIGTFANAQDGKIIHPVKKEIKKDAKKVGKKVKKAGKKEGKKVKSAAKKDVKKVKKAIKKKL